MLTARCSWQLRTVLQVYESHLADDTAVHDSVMDIHSCNDCEGHCLREGTSSEGSDEGDGPWQRRALAVVVHHQLCHDAHLRVSACRRTQGK